jgi:hypothetical protein
VKKDEQAYTTQEEEQTLLFSQISVDTTPSNTSGDSASGGEHESGGGRVSGGNVYLGRRTVGLSADPVAGRVRDGSVVLGVGHGTRAALKN